MFVLVQWQISEVGYLGSVCRRYFRCQVYFLAWPSKMTESVQVCRKQPLQQAYFVLCSNKHSMLACRQQCTCSHQHVAFHIKSMLACCQGLHPTTIFIIISVLLNIKNRVQSHVFSCFFCSTNDAKFKDSSFLLILAFSIAELLLWLWMETSYQKICHF